MIMQPLLSLFAREVALNLNTGWLGMSGCLPIPRTGFVVSPAAEMSVRRRVGKRSDLENATPPWYLFLLSLCLPNAVHILYCPGPIFRIALSSFMSPIMGVFARIVHIFQLDGRVAFSALLGS